MRETTTPARRRGPAPATGSARSRRVADRRKPTAGRRQAVGGQRATRIDVTVPSAPIAGPPVHWPTASAWLTIESVVARTVESSTLRLSQAAKSGARDLARHEDAVRPEEREPEAPGQAEDEGARRERRIEPRQRARDPCRRAVLEPPPDGHRDDDGDERPDDPEDPEPDDGVEPGDGGRPTSSTRCACQSRS